MIYGTKGHLNRYGLKLLGLPFSNKICSTCIESKAARNVFHNKEKISLQIGDIIHTDIASPVG